MWRSRFIGLLGVVLPLMHTGCEDPTALPRSTSMVVLGMTEPDYNEFAQSLPVQNANRYGSLAADELNSIHVQWNDVRYPKKKILTVSGQLYCLEDGKKSVVGWKGVRILIAKNPDTKLDWQQSYNRREAAIRECWIEDDGKFSVTFQAGELNRRFGEPAPFQVGVVIGEVRGKMMAWNSKIPVLTNSISTLRIDGQPKFDATTMLINESYSWDREPDPIPMIRATNHLRSLGKDGAIKALRHYLKLEDEIDRWNLMCLRLLVRVLFPSQTNGEPVPEEFAWQSRHTGVIVAGDIPFYCCYWYGPSSGSSSVTPQDTDRRIEWAHKFGKLRETPLRPTEGPLSAAEEAATLASLECVKHDCLTDGTELRRDLYRQANRMVFDHLKRIDPKLDFEMIGDSDQTWRYFQRTKSLRLKWDDPSQQYVVRE